jgi:xylulokinase
VADTLHLRVGIPVSFRAGDQPNNAYSLNVLQPGEIAATAGTSGVVYGITDKVIYDPKSRVNTFVHVNHREDAPRYGVLLCINGTGSLNSWLRREVFFNLSYNEMNAKAASIPIGSEGLMCYPFGNGAERVLENKDPGAIVKGLQFYRHNQSHLIRAAQEGIVFALYYGMSLMQQMGMNMHTVRAGHANMFLSDVFAQTFANTSQCVVELYNTDGALGAARAAGVGAGLYKSFGESFTGMDVVKRIEPNASHKDQTQAAYNCWKNHLSSILS